MTATPPLDLPNAAVDAHANALLERNLKALAIRNPDLAERLATVTAGDVTWFTAADGVLSALYATQTLASRHAPKEEAEQIANRVDLREKAVAVVLGFGLGSAQPLTIIITYNQAPTGRTSAARGSRCKTRAIHNAV